MPISAPWRPSMQSAFDQKSKEEKDDLDSKRRVGREEKLELNDKIDEQLSLMRGGGEEPGVSTRYVVPHNKNSTFP